MKIWIILLLWNLFVFVLIGIDKRRAVNQQWRVSERTFFVMAFLFGAVGMYSGMKLFHHKTKKTSFRIIVPLAMICNLLLIIVMIKINYEVLI